MFNFFCFWTSYELNQTVDSIETYFNNVRYIPIKEYSYKFILIAVRCSTEWIHNFFIHSPVVNSHMGCIQSLVIHAAMNILVLFPSMYVQALLVFFWLHWVFTAARGLSLVAASGGYSSLQCAGFSLWWLLLLRSTGSRHAGFSSCSTQAP